MSESNKWFRDKWNRLDKLKWIDNWFDVFNNEMENQILDRYNKIEKNIMEEKIERVNKDLEKNWWNYEIFLRERIEKSDIKDEKK